MQEPIKLPPQAQQLLLQMQTFQQQLQTIMIQKENLNIQKIESEKALEELGKVEKEDVFKAVGPILVKSTKEKMTKELNEKVETTQIRLKTLEKQEEKIQGKLKENQEKIQEFLKDMGKAE